MTGYLVKCLVSCELLQLLLQFGKITFFSRRRLRPLCTSQKGSRSKAICVQIRRNNLRVIVHGSSRSEKVSHVLHCCNLSPPRVHSRPLDTMASLCAELAAIFRPRTLQFVSIVFLVRNAAIALQDCNFMRHICSQLL